MNETNPLNPAPPNLTDLAHQFFSRKYECIIPPPDSTIRGRSGQKWKFDMILKFNDQNYGIFVRSWNRSIGVNQIRQLEKACRDTKFAGGLIVGNQFSSNAEIYGENLGIQIVDRATLIRKLQSHL
ncbi:MAG: restriction endonuclease [Promethearchaeota archaeon]